MEETRTDGALVTLSLLNVYESLVTACFPGLKCWTLVMRGKVSVIKQLTVKSSLIPGMWPFNHTSHYTVSSQHVVEPLTLIAIQIERQIITTLNVCVWSCNPVLFI